VGVCALIGKSAQIPRLIEYVNDRDAMLERIADHFKVDKSACKYVVLRVLNGGSVHRWCTDMGLGIPAEIADDQTDLRDLAGEALVIRQAFFEHVDAREPGTSDRIKQIARSFIEQKNINLTRMGQPPKRVSSEAILRTAFSHCIFEVEDIVLKIIDRYFRKNRWTVGSLIYDGLHIEHRPGDVYDGQKWNLLDQAMRGAEQAIERKTGFKIKLVEKPLYARP